MGSKSSIEWTDATWTPIRVRSAGGERVGWGCEKVSDGCKNCYAETLNKRLGTGLPYAVGAVTKADGEYFLDEEMLTAPLRWRKPRRVFVCSMTDLFGEWVPDEWIDRMFAVMALTPQHTYQVLTKRPERAREYLTQGTSAQVMLDGTKVPLEPGCFKTAWDRVFHLMAGSEEGRKWRAANSSEDFLGPHGLLPKWPLPNVWLGTSAENQRWADVRIPELLATPAAVHFISYEPALGPITFDERILGRRCECQHDYYPYIPGKGWQHYSQCRASEEKDWVFTDKETAYKLAPGARIDWVIVGGESGPGARPFDIAWARSTVAQCRAAGVACFVKQLGSNPIGVFDPGFSPWKARKHKGGDMEEWPEDLRVREMPALTPGPSPDFAGEGSK